MKISDEDLDHVITKMQKAIKNSQPFPSYINEDVLLALASEVLAARKMRDALGNIMISGIRAGKATANKAIAEYDKARNGG